MAQTGSESASIKEERELKLERLDPNAEFGGLEARKALEKKLLRKIDLRMLILVRPASQLSRPQLVKHVRFSRT